MTAKEKILGSVLGVMWLGGFAAVWQVTAPEYSDANKARIFLCYLAIGIVLLLWWIREIKGRRMSFFEFLIWGGGLGLVAGFIVWGMFAIAEKSPAVAQVEPKAEPVAESDNDFTALLIPRGATVPVTMSPLIPNPNEKPADPNDLEFYFFSLMATTWNDWVQYADVTITNRSPRKMHLEVWGQVDYWDDNGEPQRYGTKAVMESNVT